MALNTPGLKGSIIQLMNDMKTRDTDSVEEFADRLATAMEMFVKSGSVTVSAGIPVATAGTATNQTGTTTSTGSGTIS